MLSGVKDALSILMSFMVMMTPAVQAANPVDYPTKPIELVVPFAPGGATDVLARLVADKLREKLGQTVLVLNKPGAGGEIAVDFVRRAPADGYTLLVTSSNFAVAPFISKTATRDTLEDFSHIIALAQVPWLLVVNESVPARSASEFVQYARANPGKLNWGLVGAEDFEVELFLQKAGLDIEKIRYQGTAPLMQALLSKEIDVVFSSIRAVQGYIDSGLVRGLAVTTLDRSPQTPDIPSLSEEAIPGYDGSSIWFGVSGTAGISADIVATLNHNIQEVLNMPEIISRLDEIKMQIIGGSPEGFTQYIAQDIARMQAIVDISGIKPN